MNSASGKSLDRLEREVEQNRGVLVDTVDALRASVLGEVAELRHTASLDYVGTEIRNRVRANPLRSFAIGAGLTLPLWRMGRRVPMPLLLIGAGVALARPTAKQALADAASDASDRVKQAGNRSGDALSGAWTNVKTASTQAGQQVATSVDAARDSVREATHDATARASDLMDAGHEAAAGLADTGRSLLQGGSDHLADARDYAGRKVTQTQSLAVELFHKNPLLVAGAGLVLGALFAAIVPATETEGRLLDKVAPDLKQKASDLVDQGYDTVRAAVSDVYDGAVGHAKEQGLTPEGAHDVASDLSERLGAVVDAAIGQHGAEHSDDTNKHS